VFRQEQMYKPSGGKSPQNARESSLPTGNSTWHREPYNEDPRTDKTDRDKLSAGKRHWDGDQSSNMTSFQGVTSGASLSGNGFVPRSKPRFQGVSCLFSTVISLQLHVACLRRFCVIWIYSV
jgi:hypothetical protein